MWKSYFFELLFPNFCTQYGHWLGWLAVSRSSNPNPNPNPNLPPHHLWLPFYNRCQWLRLICFLKFKKQRFCKYVISPSNFYKTWFLNFRRDSFICLHEQAMLRNKCKIMIFLSSDCPRSLQLTLMGLLNFFLKKGYDDCRGLFKETLSYEQIRFTAFGIRITSTTCTMSTPYVFSPSGN